MKCSFIWEGGGFRCKNEAMAGTNYCAKHYLHMKPIEKTTNSRIVGGSWGSTDYSVYIKSKEWKMRSDLFRLQHPTCRNCNRRGQLYVHHRTYERLGKERDDDLTVLCKDCHDLFHKNYVYDRKEHIFIKRKF